MKNILKILSFLIYIVLFYISITLTFESIIAFKYIGGFFTWRTDHQKKLVELTFNFKPSDGRDINLTPKLNRQNYKSNPCFFPSGAMVSAQSRNPTLGLFCFKGCQDSYVGDIAIQGCSKEVLDVTLNSNYLFHSKWMRRVLFYQFEPKAKDFSFRLQEFPWIPLAGNRKNFKSDILIAGRFKSTNSNGVNKQPKFSYHSPLIDLSPTVTFLTGCDQVYLIPIFDPNAMNYVECALIQNPLNLKGVTINKETCVLEFKGSKHSGKIPNNLIGNYPFIVSVMNYQSESENARSKKLDSTERYSTYTQIHFHVKLIDFINDGSHPKITELCEIAKPILLYSKSRICIEALPGRSIEFNVTAKTTKQGPNYDIKYFDINWMPITMNNITRLSMSKVKDSSSQHANSIYKWIQWFRWSPTQLLEDRITLRIMAITELGYRSEPTYLTLSTDDCFEPRRVSVKWEIG